MKLLECATIVTRKQTKIHTVIVNPMSAPAKEQDIGNFFVCAQYLITGKLIKRLKHVVSVSIRE